MSCERVSNLGESKLDGMPTCAQKSSGLRYVMVDLSALTNVDSMFSTIGASSMSAPRSRSRLAATQGTTKHYMHLACYPPSTPGRADTVDVPLGTMSKVCVPA